MSTTETFTPTVIVTTFEYPKGGGEPTASRIWLPIDEAPVGRPEETVVHDPDGELRTKAVYLYEDKPPETTFEYDANGKLVSKTEYVWDADGSLVSKTTTPGGDTA